MAAGWFPRRPGSARSGGPATRASLQNRCNRKEEEKKKNAQNFSCQCVGDGCLFVSVVTDLAAPASALCGWECVILALLTRISTTNYGASVVLFCSSIVSSAARARIVVITYQWDASASSMPASLLHPECYRQRDELITSCSRAAQLPERRQGIPLGLLCLQIRRCRWKFASQH